MSIAQLQKRIRQARGQEPADLVIANARLVNVLSGEIHPADVAVGGGVVLGVEEPGKAPQAAETLDAGGAFLCPGFIDGHVHVESSLLTPPRFAEVAAARGTAAIVCDPHEIANVLGRDGLEYMLAVSRDMPLAVFVMMPSCVPATHLETAGGSLDFVDVAELLAAYPERIPGLAEMMNFPGVLFGDDSVLAKLLATRGKVRDGHAPGVSGPDLSAYILAGPASDHECVNAGEARQKLRKGMHLMLREGTSEKNLADLLPAVTPHNSSRCMLVSDDRLVSDLVSAGAEGGHMDGVLRKAVSLGLDPVTAVQMATINPARYFGLDRMARKRGAVAPGYEADMVLVEDLSSFRVRQAFLGGQRVQDLDFASPVSAPGNTMNVDIRDNAFRVPAHGGKMRVITVTQGQIVTGQERVEPLVRDGHVEADPERDLAKLAVVERHTGSGNVGLGFVRGLKLAAGALAGSVAHDSHNLVVAGMDDQSMLTAARAVADMGGGLVVAKGGAVLAKLPLPVAGLMSDKPAAQVDGELKNLHFAAREAGCGLDNPFALLSFLSLPVIPDLKLTDKGLVDVNRFDFVDLFEEL